MLTTTATATKTKMTAKTRHSHQLRRTATRKSLQERRSLPKMTITMMITMTTTKTPRARTSANASAHGLPKSPNSISVPTRSWTCVSLTKARKVRLHPVLHELSRHTLTLPRTAIQYARIYVSDKASWKFNKAKQNWLLRNALACPPADYDPSVSTKAAAGDEQDEDENKDEEEGENFIPEPFVPVVIEYLRSVVGGARQVRNNVPRRVHLIQC